MKFYGKSIIGIFIGILLFSGCSSKKEEAGKSDVDGSKPTQFDDKETEEVALEPNKENEEVTKEEDDNAKEASSKASDPKEVITKGSDNKLEKPVIAPKTEEKPAEAPVEAPAEEAAAEEAKAE